MLFQPSDAFGFPLLELYAPFGEVDQFDADCLSLLAISVLFPLKSKLLWCMTLMAFPGLPALRVDLTEVRWISKNSSSKVSLSKVFDDCLSSWTD